ncbi:hypothetical protein GCM10011505_14990 [Tistrella bauzanensis]|uniref:Uncharacterized protein n=1 Tax=Tistrella bauzanensis TaxID=657419 RepID=A0ABQ1IDN3_9PROT|nr:hypothetical protein GCM10011505_14990 [Tistrella bauzanensis]
MMRDVEKAICTWFHCEPSGRRLGMRGADACRPGTPHGCPGADLSHAGIVLPMFILVTVILVKGSRRRSPSADTAALISARDTEVQTLPWPKIRARSIFSR